MEHGTANRSSCFENPEGQPIRYFNRYTQRIENEPIYQEHFLRLLYGTAPGRLSLAVLERPFFSKMYGWAMNRPASRKRIAPFIHRYGVQPEEFCSTIEDFESFNDFFKRQLKPRARPICGALRVAFPVDGRHLGFQNVSQMKHLSVKGQSSSLASLLGRDDLAERYTEGSFVISRLSALDYHRFHFPVAGIATEATLAKGPLRSVNPVALKGRLERVFTNKRMVTQIASADFGFVTMVEVGALAVGSIRQTYQVGHVEKGQEKGYFEFGGSAVVTLFEKNTVRLASDLVEHTKSQRELFARMGDVMAFLP